MECVKCKNKDDSPSLICDGCGNVVHRSCSSLTSSELKVMDLKGSRILKFYCEECADGIKMLPKLCKIISQLQDEISMLRNQIQTYSEETVINEINDRQKKMHNILIHNLPESDNNKDSDLLEVKKIIREVAGEDFPINRLVRVGKENKNGARSLKVIFSSPDDALYILKNKKKLKNRKPKIYIDADLTPRQMEKIKKLQDELRIRRNDGEQNIFIKYVKGVPQIAKN